MAAKYRRIDPRIWNDEKFRKLTFEGRAVALYCLTTDQSNRIGIFNFNVFKAADDLGLKYTVFDTVFNTVCNTMNWHFAKVFRILYLPTWWKYNQPDNEKHFLGCMKDLDDIPNCELKLLFLTNCIFLDGDFKSLMDTVSKRYSIQYRNSMAYQEQDQDQEQDQEQETSPCGDVKISIPENLDLPEFNQAWSEWVRHRKEIRHALKPTTERAQLKKLSAMGSRLAIQAIRNSIEHGYIGLFEPNGKNQNNKPKTQNLDDDWAEYHAKEGNS